jgi:hypothetical protein
MHLLDDDERGVDLDDPFELVVLVPGRDDEAARDARNGVVGTRGQRDLRQAQVHSALAEDLDLVLHRPAADLDDALIHLAEEDVLANVLDIGLPVTELKAPIRRALAGAPLDAVELEVRDRRGRPITTRVVLSPLLSHESAIEGAILAITFSPREETAPS